MSSNLHELLLQVFFTQLGSLESEVKSSLKVNLRPKKIVKISYKSTMELDLTSFDINWKKRKELVKSNIQI